MKTYLKIYLKNLREAFKSFLDGSSEADRLRYVSRSLGESPEEAVDATVLLMVSGLKPAEIQKIAVHYSRHGHLDGAL